MSSRHFDDIFRELRADVLFAREVFAALFQPCRLTRSRVLETVRNRSFGEADRRNAQGPARPGCHDRSG